MRAGPLALLLVLFALVPAAPALADDAAVRAAFNSKNAELVKAAQARQATQNRWVSSGFRKLKPYLKALRHMRALAAEVADAIEAAEPSTDIGAQARRTGIESFEALEASVTQAIASAKASTGAVKAYANHKQRKGDRLRRRAKKHANKSGKQARRAVRLAQKAADLLAQLPAG